MSSTPLNALTEKVRAAHPGVYDDFDDAELTKRVLAKYPQYSDLAAPPVQPPKERQGDMQEESMTPAETQNFSAHAASGKLAGLPGVNPHTPTTSEALGDVGLVAGGAYGAGSSILPAAVRKTAPYAIPAAASYAINKARSIPVVGPIIDKIPYAEAIPWLMSGKGKESEEGAPVERDATRSNVPYAGEAEAIETAPKAAPAEANPIAAPQPSPAIDTAPKVTPGKVGDLLNESLGGKSLLPNVPLREQMPGKVPAGHSPVESSAIKSYKYDPASREFEFVTPSGAHYVHGDVSPEQIADFEKAGSKGKAFNEIKKNSTYVAKIVNGKRMAVKPDKNLASAAP